MSATLTIRSSASKGAIELARLLKSKIPDLKCCACGKRDFGLLELPDEGWRTTLVRHNTRGEPLQISQSLVTTICTSCGHVEHFAEAILNGAASSQYGEDKTDG